MSVLPRPMARGMIKHVVIVLWDLWHPRGALVNKYGESVGYDSMGLSIGLGLLTDLEVLSKFKPL